MPRMMSVIPQIPIIISQQQHISYVMPDKIVVACKFKQELSHQGKGNNLRMVKVHIKY
jgi:hypothetical protein